MMRRPTGLEPLLRQWGVGVAQNVVLDPDNASNPQGIDPKPVNPGVHPTVNSLGRARVRLTNPRSLYAIDSGEARRDDAKVDELLFTGPKSQMLSDFNERGIPRERKQVGSQPLMVAVEKSIPAVQRGATRIVALGDTAFWANQLIEVDANAEFAAHVVNWLVGQNILLADIPRRAVATYKLTMTRSQMRNVRWLLLGAMPAAILLLGFIVAARRRS
jgi:hypothetical protein